MYSTALAMLGKAMYIPSHCNATPDNALSRGAEMDTALTVIEQPALPAELLEPLRLAADFAQNSKAPATRAAYASDFRIFEALVPLSRIKPAAGLRCGRGGVPR
jgi:hypothetical protein